MSIVRRFGPIPVAGAEKRCAAAKYRPLANNQRTATIARVAAKKANGRAISNDK
jgi:hypothetical protein